MAHRDLDLFRIKPAKIEIEGPQARAFFKRGEGFDGCDHGKMSGSCANLTLSEGTLWKNESVLSLQDHLLPSQ
jgi:hypothetical protein